MNRLNPNNPATRRRPPLWLVAVSSVVFSSLLLAFAQTCVRGGWCVFFALVPMLLVIQPRRFAATWAALGVVAGVSTSLSISWIRYTGDHFAWLLPLVAIYIGSYFLVPAAACVLTKRASCPLAPLLILPAAWALVELLGRHILLGVWWPLLGQPLADWPVFAQSAALFGPETVSYLVVSMNVSIALCLRAAQRRTKLLGLIGGPGLLIVMLIWGCISLWLPSIAPREAAVLRVGVIQPNIKQLEKWNSANRIEVLTHMDKLIDGILDDNPDIIVLPETALAGYVRYEDDLTEWVKGVVQRTRRPLVFGTLDHNESESQLYNSVVMITPYNTVFTQHKVRLVPITERLPNFGPINPWIQPLWERLRGGMDEFTPGEQQMLFQLMDGPTFATLVCFEDIFPDLAREYVNAGADFLIAVINTERFWESSQAWQHLRRARLTAICSGVPLVRCANSGISCWIDGKGRLIQTIQNEQQRCLLVSGAGVFPVRPTRSQTLYGRCGDTLAFLVWSGIVIIGALAARRWPSQRALTRAFLFSTLSRSR
jgi:apolipoprotein N-acyltransferase